MQHVTSTSRICIFLLVTFPRFVFVACPEHFFLIKKVDHGGKRITLMFLWTSTRPRELTYPPEKACLKMMFRFPRWDILEAIKGTIRETCVIIPWLRMSNEKNMVVSGHMGMDYDKPLLKILMKQPMGNFPSFLLWA